MTRQTGFPPPTRNYYQVPHNFIDILSGINSLAEVKTLNYLLRHTWGFHEYDIPKHLKIDEIVNGRRVSKDIAKRKGYEFREGYYRMDRGTGLSRTSVKKGLKEIIKDGLGLEYIDNRDKARIEKFYMLIIVDQPIYRHFEGAALSDFCIEELKNQGYTEDESGDFIWPQESGGQDLTAQDVDLLNNDTQDVGGKNLTPGGKDLTVRGLESDPRTGERNSINSCCTPRIKRLKEQIQNATGEQVNDQYIISLLEKWEESYIQEKVELASKSKIEDTAAGFLYKALQNDWTRTEPTKRKEKRPSPDNKKKEFLKSLYTT